MRIVTTNRDISTLCKSLSFVQAVSYCSFAPLESDEVVSRAGKSKRGIYSGTPPNCACVRISSGWRSLACCLILD